MSSYGPVTLKNGNEWGVGSFLLGDACIIIPTTELNGMDNEEIGKYVKELVQIAELQNAIEIAGWVYDGSGARQFEDDLNKLQNFEGQSETIDKALVLVRQWKEEEREAERKRERKRSPTKTLRNKIIERDGKMCRYCGTSIDGVPHIDHVVPHSSGGLTKPENLVCSCRRCNSIKRDRTPEEAGMTLLEVPCG